MTDARSLAADRTTDFEPGRHWPLLAVMILTIAGTPVIHSFFGPTGAMALAAMLYMTGAVTVLRSRSLLITSIALGAVACVLHAMIVWGGRWNTGLVVALHVVACTFLLIVGLHVLRAIFRATNVTADTVLGGVSVYLLIGILFAYLFSLVETLAPGSFTITSAMKEAGDTMMWIPLDPGTDDSFDESGERHLMYFSFTTLTTLGYGDISPRSSAARSLTSLEAVVGQLHLAILVARLVAVARFSRNES